MHTCIAGHHVQWVLRYFAFTSVFFFFNDTATTEIYTLSLHDALPILDRLREHDRGGRAVARDVRGLRGDLLQHLRAHVLVRSEEHTSELQSQSNLVCRLLLEKKNNRHSACPLTPASRPHNFSPSASTS